MAEAFRGLVDLIDDLRRMPSRLESEASIHVQTAADTMAAEVLSEYPERTGALERGVRVQRINAFRATVRSGARHASIYERGTVERMHANGKGVGRMPKANVFIPAAVKARRAMVERIVRAVERQTVRGMTGRLQVEDDHRD